MDEATVTVANRKRSTGAISLTIDGRIVRADEGQTVLEAASNDGIYIPSLCAYRDLKPLAEEVPDRACQLCLVDVGGQVVLSCTTPVAEGLVVKINTPRVQELRKKHLNAILRRHPSDCLTCHRLERCGPLDICLRQVTVSERCVLCPKNKNCDLQRAVDHIGITLLEDANIQVFDEIMRSLKAEGVEYISVTVGGLVKEQDIPHIQDMGVRAFFPRGTSFRELAEWAKKNITSAHP